MQTIERPAGCTGNCFGCVLCDCLWDGYTVLEQIEQDDRDTAILRARKRRPGWKTRTDEQRKQKRNRANAKRKAHLEEARAREREYAEKNREAIRLRKQVWYLKNKERLRQERREKKGKQKDEYV